MPDMPVNPPALPGDRIRATVFLLFDQLAGALEEAKLFDVTLDNGRLADLVTGEDAEVLLYAGGHWLRVRTSVSLEKMDVVSETELAESAAQEEEDDGA